jgi:hypothetical protein
MRQFQTIHHRCYICCKCFYRIISTLAGDAHASANQKKQWFVWFYWSSLTGLPNAWYYRQKSERKLLACLQRLHHLNRPLIWGRIVGFVPLMVLSRFTYIRICAFVLARKKRNSNKQKTVRQAVEYQSFKHV